MAELITKADSAPEDSAAQRDCAQAIRQLWEARATFPGPSQPLASFEPIVRALERLDPERPRWGYFDDRRRKADLEGDTSAIYTELALRLDESMGGVIRFLMREAAASAVDSEHEWIDPIDQSGDDEPSLVSSIIESLGYGNSDDKRISDALSSVMAVQKVLDAIADSLRQRNGDE
ncbi:hypothetical protein [Leifsonia shinshuensis]|uniref:Uncharacterized protein n=1 Tax=Leifsonia shinshuensis TaxID=150026 RepID=A0A7G6YEE0_9MICO|nr:hypothetical protein [Leifsonia shinshuensis]QNE36855.1 hypothetical protein F1C12_18200 [Leifsonia shinshuensis]